MSNLVNCNCNQSCCDKPNAGSQVRDTFIKKEIEQEKLARIASDENLQSQIDSLTSNSSKSIIALNNKSVISDTLPTTSQSADYKLNGLYLNAVKQDDGSYKWSAQKCIEAIFDETSQLYKFKWEKFIDLSKTNLITFVQSETEDDNIYGVNSGITSDINFDSLVYKINEKEISNKQDKITETNKLDYSLISNTPNIPTKTSELENDSDFTTQEKLDNVNVSLTNQINNHIRNIENPHNVTKSQIGLDKVDNTSDKEKPISDATQTALDSKQNKITTENKLDYSLLDNTPVIPTKTSELTNDSNFVDENYVNNHGGKIDKITVNNVEQEIVDKTVNIVVPTKTSELTNDSNFASRSDLDTKQDNLNENQLAAVNSGITSAILENINTKLDTIPTKTSELTNDSDFINKTAVNNLIKVETDRATEAENTLTANLTSHIENTNNPHNVTKAQIGLSDVDNTSDANKPVSTAQAAAIKTVDDKVVDINNKIPVEATSENKLADKEYVKTYVNNNASAKLKEELTTQITIGSVSAGTVFAAGTSLEEIIRRMFTATLKIYWGCTNEIPTTISPTGESKDVNDDILDTGITCVYSTSGAQYQYLAYPKVYGLLKHIYENNLYEFDLNDGTTFKFTTIQIDSVDYYFYYTDEQAIVTNDEYEYLFKDRT